jgi:hypothetical protein
MKQRNILFIILLSPFFVFAQNSKQKFNDTLTKQIQNGIYRITLTQPLTPDYETITLAGNYEHKLKKAFSIVGKFGVGTSVKKFGSADNPNQTSFHVFGAIETRYYFSLYRRLRKEKTVLNFSAPYISLEQNLFTNPIALINQTKKEAFEGSTRLFLNVGYQKQISKLYLGAFFGVSFLENDFSKYDKGRSITPIHGGLTVGYVF